MKVSFITFAATGWIGFLILILPFLYISSEVAAVLVCQLGGLYLLSLLVYSRCFHPGDGDSRRFFRLIMLWLAVLGLSTCFSVDISSSFYAYLRVISLVLIAGTVRYALDDPTARGVFLGCALLALFGHGGMAISEYLEGGAIPPSWIDPGMRGMIRTRSAGLFGDPNLLGAYLAMLWPFALAGCFHPGVSSGWLPLGFAGLLVGGLGLLTTLSRGAYLALGMGMLMLVLLLRPRPSYSGRKLWTAAVLLVLVAVFLIGPFKSRFMSVANTADMTLSQRSLINRGILAALPHVPLTGFGLHTFNLMYPRFRVVGGDYPLNAHNEFLQSFIETGLAGTIFLAALCWLLLRRGWALFRHPRERVGWVAAASMAGFTIFCVQNLTGFSARVFPLAVIGACTVGGVLNGMRWENRAAFNWFHVPRWRRPFRVLIFLFLFFTIHHAYLQHLIQATGRAIHEGHLIEAEADLKILERLASRNPLVFFLYAQLEESRGRLLNAAFRFRTALMLNPLEAVYAERLAGVLERSGEIQAAGEAWEAAVSLDPASERFRLRFAEFLIRTGFPGKAEIQLQEALRYSPGHHEVYQGYRHIETLKRHLELLPASSTLSPPVAPHPEQ